jgi:hypothetical protein
MTVATDRLETVEALRAELARQRARASTYEQLIRTQAASLAELADLAGELRCQVADLADDALSSSPMPVGGLRNVTARMSGLADTLSRTATGYTGARVTDMVYPTVCGDLTAHGWTPRPARGLSGALPPIPVGQLGERRGYARGWHRGPQWITVWFTGPDSLVYVDSSDHGRLVDVDVVRAVITSRRSLSASELTRWVAARQDAHTVPFNATHARVIGHLRATWGAPLETSRCDSFGAEQEDGPGRKYSWASPINPDLRILVWGVGEEPVHVRYWGGPVVDMEHLVYITGQYRRPADQSR